MMVEEHERKCRLHDQVQRWYDGARIENDWKDALAWALVGLRLAVDLMRPTTIDSWKLRIMVCDRERKSALFEDWAPKEWVEWPAS